MKISLFSHRAPKLFTAVILAQAIPFAAHAVSNTWSAGSSGNWNSAANWLGGTNIPGSTSATNNTDTATFSTINGVTVTVDANRNLQTLAFEGAAGSFTLSGGSLTLTGGNTTSTSYLGVTLTGSNLTQTISSPISITGNYTFANYSADSTNKMVLGDISSTVAGRTLTLTGGNTGDNTVSGVISNGSGGISLTKSGTGRWVLTGANTYTGATSVYEGEVALSGASGSLALSGSTTLVAAAGTLRLSNLQSTGGNNNNRIADTQAFQINGSFIYQGSDAAATDSSETVGAVTFRNGSPVFTVNYGGTNAATLTAASLGWAGATPGVLVNGRNLGKDSTSTSEVSRFFSTAAPTTVGTTAALSTGINAAAKNTRIVTAMVGESAVASGGTGTDTGVANTFVTYNATTGFRPLNPTDEFTHNSIVTGHNTYITADTTVAASGTINSLVLNEGNVQISAGQTLTTTSGAVLFVGSESISGGGAVTSGSTALRAYVNAGEVGTISSAITGTGGLNKSGAGDLIVSGSNTGLSGNVLINSGTLYAGNNQAFGSGVVSLYGSEAVLAAYGGARTIANDVAFTNDTAGLAAGVIGGEEDLTISGKVYNSNTTSASLEISNSGLTTFAGGIYTASTGNGRDLTLTGSGDIVANGVHIAASSPGTGGILRYVGTGTLRITNTSTYQGLTSVSGGTVNLDFSNMATPTNMIVSTSQLVLGGGTLEIKGKSGAVSTSQTFDATSGNDLDLLASSRSGIRLNANGGTGTTLTIGNTWVRRTNSVLNVELGADTTLTSSPITSVTTQAANSAIINYMTVNDGSGTGFGIVQNGNIVRYTAADTLTATTNDSNTNYKTSGNLAMNSGTRSVRSLTLDASVAGNLDLSAGTQLTFLAGGPSAVLMSGSQNYSITGGTLGSNGAELIIHQMGSGVLTISSQLMGSSGSFVKNGSGTLVLSGTNTYSGATLVTMGTLVVDGSLANSAVTVNSGGVLAGGGTLGNAVTVLAGGELNAGGGSAGRNLTLAALTLNNEATMRFNIDGAGAGQHDSLSVWAPFTLDGNLILDFGTVLANGSSIDLYSGVVGSGAFDQIVGVGAYAGTFVNGVLDTGSQVLTFNSSTGMLSVVPETSTAGYLLLGMGLCLWLFRRRRAC